MKKESQNAIIKLLKFYNNKKVLSEKLKFDGAFFASRSTPISIFSQNKVNLLVYFVY